MLLNASTSRRSSSDEVAAMRASRSPRAMRLVARQAIDWIGDSLCHRVAKASAGEDEEKRRKRSTIERVELIVDVTLSGCQRQ